MRAYRTVLPLNLLKIQPRPLPFDSIVNEDLQMQSCPSLSVKVIIDPTYMSRTQSLWLSMLKEDKIGDGMDEDDDSHSLVVVEVVEVVVVLAKGEKRAE